MTNKKTNKKIDVIEESKSIKRITRRISIEEINGIENIGEMNLKTYEMIRNKLLNLK